MFNNLFKISDANIWSNIYNIVNTIFPIGVFIITIIYLFCDINTELISDNFNFSVEKKFKKPLYTMNIFFFSISSIPSIWLGKCKFIGFKVVIAAMIAHVIIIIYIIIQILNERKLINVLIKEPSKYLSIFSIIITALSGFICGCGIANGEYFLSIVIVIFTFMTYGLISFLIDIHEVNEVELINEKNEVISKGKIFKLQYDFICIIEKNRNVRFINKNQVMYIKPIKKLNQFNYINGGVNMNDEQIKEITIALIEKGILYAGENNEGTASEIAKFINKLREETNK